MIINIDEEISSDTLTTLMGAYNALGEDEILTIFLRSEGGAYGTGEAIIDLISMNAEWTQITAYEVLGSTAFHVFFRSQCLSKRITGTCCGVIHQVRVPVLIGESGEPIDDANKFFVSSINNKVYKDSVELYSRLGLTKKEMDYVYKGNDLYLDIERMTDFYIMDDAYWSDMKEDKPSKSMGEKINGNLGK